MESASSFLMMAGVPICPSSPIGTMCSSKIPTKNLYTRPKSTCKSRICCQNPHQNPSFAPQTHIKVLPHAVAPIQTRCTYKTHSKILCAHPKHTWKSRICRQYPHQNPLFSPQTQLHAWVRPPSNKNGVPADSDGGTNSVSSPPRPIKFAIDAYVAIAEGKIRVLLEEVAHFLHLLFLVDFKRIKEGLEGLQCFLNKRSIEDESEDIRDQVYFEIIYVIDYIETFSQTAQRLQLIIARIIVACQVFEIRLKIRDIFRSKELYGIFREINEGRREASSSIPSLQDLRQFSSEVKEPEVVGQQEEINTLREQLISEEPRQRRVISIVGMPGSGKTTLAKKVYDEVKKQFECHAFICISQQYDIKDVLMRIAKCLYFSEEETKNLTQSQLGVKLLDYFKEKRYLVVIDDIWSTEAWDEMLEPILPDAENKSRVMVTTRFKWVALNADSSRRPHEVRLLNGDESWELFMKKIFGKVNHSVPCFSELMESKLKESLAKCGGLPLAILVLGGLLKSEDLTFWSQVLERVNQNLTESSNECGKILALSYRDLPNYLKPCFLYFGLLPEDSEIYSMTLIRLWIAEGFIQQRDNEVMEDVAENYLKELVGRSMIQVSQWTSYGSVKMCRIHDLLRELSISKGKQNNFFTIHDVDSTCLYSTSVKRLALHRSISRYHQTTCLCLFSILNFCKVDVSQLELRRANLLRVVSEELWLGIPILSLTEEVSEFVYLRHLEISAGKCYQSSIGDLNNLQTLILHGSYGLLPSVISNLKQLRHLDALGNYDWEGNLSVNNLTNLQTLCLMAGSWIEDGLGKLTNLRELRIVGYTSSYHKALTDSMEKLKNLRSLSLSSRPPDRVSLPPFIHLLQLNELRLWGRIRQLPELPPNLVELTLHYSQLEQDAIFILEKLPQLKVLNLYDMSFCSKKMIFSSRGFPRLEVLKLVRLPWVKELIVEEEALPSLKRLDLFFLDLKTLDVPERVWALLNMM